MATCSCGNYMESYESECSVCSDEKIGDWHQHNQEIGWTVEYDDYEEEEED